MESTLEALEGNKIKLSVQVASDDVDKAVDAAARKLAREVRLPGFRPGKVPRKVLEARMGHGALRQEALRESLPDFYAEAVREHEVDVIAPPEIDITEGQEGGDLKFDAVVEVRPHVQIPGYGGLQVTLDRPEATDEEVDRQVDRLRANSATLEEVSRPARDGDVLTIDLSMTAGSDEPNTLTDVSYTLGSGEFGIEELDTQLQGARIGDIIKFTANPAEGRYVSIQVLVKAVKAQVLPDLTDEWVAGESEFETVQQLRDDLRTRITAVKKVQAQLALRERALTALSELVSEDAPAPLVEEEVERRLHDLGHRLEAQGATFEQYLTAIGQTPEQFVEELRASAVPSVKADLALRALADAENLDATEEDIDAEIARLADALEQPAAQVRRSLVSGDRLPAVRSDLRKGKALAWLLEHVDVVDPEGQPIERAELQAPPAAGEDGDGEDASTEESA
ncbi:MAG TPA: trigger factor [Acidimicrobiales bacterium]|nr:trigger factor [Acidimicrobiales bacterium]